MIHRALLSCAVLWAGGSLLAAAAAAGVPTIEPVAANAAPIRLVEPGSGAVWTAGESATLAWRPGPGFGRAEGLEEWEVFLSVDGGLTFPVRLTPHLDLDRREVEVRVPDLPTENGRLLLRVGDEREELSIEVPMALRILPGGRRGQAAPGARRPGRSLVPGEAARADGRPTLFWSEADRDGAGWREREAALPAPEALRPGVSPGAPLLVPPAPGGQRLLAPAPSISTARAEPVPDPDATRPTAPALDRPILLISSRRNE